MHNSMWWHMSTTGGKFNKAGHAIRKSGFNFWLWYSFSLCDKSFHLPKLLFPQFKWDNICLLFQILWELIYSYLGKHFKFVKQEPLLDLSIKLTCRLGILLINSKPSGPDMFTAIWNPSMQLLPQLLTENVYSWHTGISSLNYTSPICDRTRTVTRLNYCTATGLNLWHLRGHYI